MYVRMYDELKRTAGDNQPSDWYFVPKQMQTLQDIPF